MSNYYEADDLKKFANITRVNPDLGNKFFDYYSCVMAEGALTEREKGLIALALAHALKCPYCIDAYTKTCLEKGCDEAQMNEAIHTASAIAAAVNLVHSVQMMNKIDDLTL